MNAAAAITETMAAVVTVAIAYAISASNCSGVYNLCCGGDRVVLRGTITAAAAVIVMHTTVTDCSGNCAFEKCENIDDCAAAACPDVTVDVDAAIRCCFSFDT